MGGSVCSVYLVGFGGSYPIVKSVRNAAIILETSYRLLYMRSNEDGMGTPGAKFFAADDIERTQC